MSTLIDRLGGGLIVSCQAPADSPLHGPTFMTAMAVAAQRGGAVAIRADGTADIAAIKAATGLPVIGLRKVHRPPSPVYITGRYADAAAVVRAGADIVALDGTPRPRPGEERLPDLIARIHAELGVPVMADVDTVEAGAAAGAAGADLLATTLSGYTTSRPTSDGPDLVLVRRLAGLRRLPVIAEGRIWTADAAAAARHAGAHAVVVGTAITNPVETTRRFVGAIAGTLPSRAAP